MPPPLARAEPVSYCLITGSPKGFLPVLSSQGNITSEVDLSAHNCKETISWETNSRWGDQCLCKYLSIEYDS